MGLPLFMLERLDDVGFDEVAAFLAAASSEAQARALASAPEPYNDPDEGEGFSTWKGQHTGDEGFETWIHSGKSACQMIAPDSIYDAPTIVLTCVHNG